MKLDAAHRVRVAALRSTAPLSFFEFWPSWLFYAPVVAWWILLGLRYRDQSLPTAANPLIETGGLCGESKRDILDQVTGPARSLIAPYVPLTAGMPLGRAEAAAAPLGYPLVVKPEIGCNGTGVRLLASAEALSPCLVAFPTGTKLIAQAFVPYEEEAGLFYVRAPGRERGRITSVTLKHAPHVVGDGRRTLRQLVLDDPRAGRVPHLYLPRLGGRIDAVPASGERVRLVFAGNHCKGSIFEDGLRLATPALEDAVEQLARALPEFHFGRIDVRFDCPASLRQGRDFRVIEINGAGSEPTHIWDPRTKLIDAWRTQFWHYGMAFRIGAANRARGFATSGIGVMRDAWLRQRRLIASYPLND